MFTYILAHSQTSGDNSSDSEKNNIKKINESMLSVKRADAPKTTSGVSVGVWAYIKMLLTLGVVVGIIYVIYFFIKRKTAAGALDGEDSFVLLTQPLGPGKSVTVVFVAGKYLILGVTGDNVNLLSEIKDEKEIERLEILYNDKKAKDGKTGFIDLFNDLIGRSRKNKEEVLKQFDYEEDSVDFLKNQRDRINNINKDRD